MKSGFFQPHHYTLYELVPGYASPDGLTHHNAYGFRGAEFHTAKSAGIYRVVCMGESTTYGAHIRKDTDTYPGQLETLLNAACPDKKIEVLNAGVPGYTSAENLLRYIFKVESLKPDLIVFYYTHNDVHPRRLPSLSRDYKEYCRPWIERDSWRDRVLRFLRIPNHESHIGKKVRRYREYIRKGLAPSTNIAKNPPDHFKANIRSLAVLAKANGTEVLFVNPPYRYLKGNVDPGLLNPVPKAVQEHRLIVEDIAREIGFHCVDLKDIMPYPEAGFEAEHPLYVDRVHVNEKGAGVMAGLITDFISKKGVIPCAAPV